MAYNTEIIAILSSGVSFNRLLFPYFIASLVIVALNIYLNLYVIPHANKDRFEFEDNYYWNSVKGFADRNVHMQIEPGIFVYIESYSTHTNFGRKFSMEHFEEGELKSKLIAQDFRWDSTKNKWTVRNYMIRDYLEDGKQIITTGSTIDTTLNLTTEEFSRRDNAIEAMDKQELDAFIAHQKLQGSSNVNTLLIEKHRRIAGPFATFILTLIGVSVSSRKVRGGIGMHIALGLLMSTSYLVFQKFSSQFAISGMFSPLIAVWIPNILFAVLAFMLYRTAPK
jgi:lipopolysaccharide export system permease protein